MTFEIGLVLNNPSQATLLYFIKKCGHQKNIGAQV